MEEGVVLADGASFAVCYLLLAAVVVRLECRAWEGDVQKGRTGERTKGRETRRSVKLRMKPMLQSIHMHA